ncbi:CPBP family intramembrane glutamic endopeptidase [Microbispora sp. H10836]|uniref:CPBP family intramembrane glutamic endopeptidase n=1 Tax=Microbispora sp. H10836 TaxID=2729106 RepID=UPI0014727C45|nr:CPBP family intramembrane glutamic endopeptidase [Microbispora sp. H10836]
MNGWPEALRRSPARLIALTFALSVPFWLAGAVIGRLSETLPVSALMACCPLLAAMALVRRHEPRGAVHGLLRRVVDWRAAPDPGWYALAIAVPLGVMAASYAVLVLLGRSLPEPRIAPVEIPLLSAVFLVAAVCEEAGWTAYATDALRARLNVPATGVVLGVVWAVWHLVPYAQAGHGPLWIAGQCLYTVALRVVIVWLYQRSASVLAAVVCHAASNVGWSLFPDHGSHYDPVVSGTVAAGVALLVVAAWPGRSPR